MTRRTGVYLALPRSSFCYSPFGYADDTTLRAESQEELKSLLMKMKEEHEKAGLKLNIQKQRSWQLIPSLHGKQKGKKQEQWQILFSWAPKSLCTARRSNQSILKEFNPDSSLKTNVEAEAPLLWPPDMMS